MAVVEKVFCFCTTHSAKPQEQFVEDYTDYSSMLHGSKFTHDKQYCHSVHEMNNSQFD